MIRGLLIPQRFHGVEAGGADGGVDAGGEAEQGDERERNGECVRLRRW